MKWKVLGVLVIALLSGAGGWVLGHRWASRPDSEPEAGTDDTPVAEATPTEEEAVAEAQTPAPLTEPASDLLLLSQLKGQRDDVPAGQVGEAYEAIQQAWKEHDEQLAEAMDPVGYRSRLRQRVRSAWSRGQTQELAELGRKLFREDLAAWVGARAPRRRVHQGALGGPDAFRCLSCHWKPIPGGGGALVDNTFLDGDGESVDSALVRQPPPLFGAAVLELLGKEMTAELQEAVDTAEQQARASGEVVELDLTAKGVGFGHVVIQPNGFRDLSGVEGVDDDLVVKPLGWKATTATLSEAVTRALDLQLGVSGADLDEAVVGSLSAYIATLPIPRSLPPGIVDHQIYWERGADRFEQLGCASCHRPYLILKDATYSLGDAQIDLAETLGLERDDEAQGWRVWLYSDLKRHDLGEEVAEHHRFKGVDPQVFKTPPLWGIDQSTPYAHDGRATTSYDVAIGLHHGEGQVANRTYFESPPERKAELRAFLRTLTLEPHMRVPGH